MKKMLLSLVFAAAPAVALPDVVTYSARVENGAGPFNGTASVAFQLFDAATAGAEVWTESSASVVIVNGDLVHDLGSIEALDDSVLERADLFLAVTINGDTLGPRAALRAVPYALKARDAETLGGLSSTDVATDAEVAAAVAGRVVAFSQLTGVPLGLADGDNDTIVTAGVGGGLLLDASNKMSIANDGVTLGRMADSSVGSAEVVADSLTAADLAPGSVGGSEILDGAITAADIGAGQVGSDEIGVGAVQSSELGTDSVTSTKINGTLLRVFQRDAGCGGGIQLEDGACSTLACGTDVERDFSNTITDIKISYSDCSGRICNVNQNRPVLCTVSSTAFVGQLLPTSF